MGELQNNIEKYDREVKDMRVKYRTLFDEIKHVDAAIAMQGNLSRSE